MGGLFQPIQHHSIRHDAGLKIPSDQRQDSLISDPFRQSIHENVVVHPVEKPLQVHVDHNLVAFLHIITLRLLDRVMSTPARPKSITELRKCRVDQRLKNL